MAAGLPWTSSPLLNKIDLYLTLSTYHSILALSPGSEPWLSLIRYFGHSGRAPCTALVGWYSHSVQQSMSSDRAVTLTTVDALHSTTPT